mgnify:CR=1 FL=1
MKKEITIITLSIILGSGFGYGIRSLQGFSAKMPANDTPPTSTPIHRQIKACTTEWTDTKQIVTCKMYDQIQIDK